MPGLTEANGPSYISAHSADVILSDIRPFKLKADALRSINVLLDEILYNILSSSASLVTDRLRASLLGLLPTSLGKEALLEAEVELRAYWERTATSGSVPPIEDDTAAFHLHYIFELLRNKCEAYSTLNEADEDPSAEANINERFVRSGASAPKAALIAPAALYLTAILEAVCEHVLSNVGRVAARDSSRTSATVNDLFTALCEDASIYGYFRTMQVYDQIEQLSKAPRPSRRSKSFSRSDKGSMARTSTPQQDSMAHTLSGSLSRQSSESSSAAGHGHAGHTPSRSSFDKTRALRMFANGKSSHEREDSQSGHKKSNSLVSETTKQGSYEGDVDTVEDAAMLQEFDDLMRSASTMKMSLTPDRLKTMEVYKQEKDQRGQRRPVPLSAKSEVDPLSSRPPPLPSVRHVDSITEDDEESGSPKIVRSRQGSVNIPHNPTMSPPGRSRSISTSGAGFLPTSRKPVRSPAHIQSAFPASLSNSASNPNMSQTRMLHANSRLAEASGGPVRKRTKQRNRESIDLDDIMNGDDDETESQATSPRTPTVATKRTPKVSSTTRDLMDFLAEGPPVTSNAPEGVRDFLAEGPPRMFGASSASLEKPKTGRLQRMISKLNIGKDIPKPPSPNTSPAKPAGYYRPTGGPMQTGAFSPLANRPIPPRPPRPPQPISPPPSPSQVSLVDENNAKPADRKVSIAQDPSRGPSPPANAVSTSPKLSQQTPPKSILKEIPSPKSMLHANGNGLMKPVHMKFPQSGAHPPSPPPPHPIITHALSRKPVPKEDSIHSPPAVKSVPAPAHTPTPAPSPDPATPVPAQTPDPAPGISESDMLDMQRLFSSATSADECRLIFDMYLAKSRIARRQSKGEEIKAPYPSPSPSLIKKSERPPVEENGHLEHSVVEMLLGGIPFAAGAAALPLASNPNNAQPPSPPKARRLPRVPKPEPMDGSSPQAPAAPAQQDQDREEDKQTLTPTWKNAIPTHAAPTPA